MESLSGVFRWRGCPAMLKSVRGRLVRLCVTLGRTLLVMLMWLSVCMRAGAMLVVRYRLRKMLLMSAGAV